MQKYKVIDAKLDTVEYPILIGENVIDQILDLIEKHTKNSKIIIVGDTFFQNGICASVENKLSDKFEIYSYYMDAGKGNKSINEVLKIFGILEENNLARDSVLIAVGGGVIGDLAGFVASTWLRGMNLIHIPTTLMAMVDSSVGGKVAINYRQTINAIGNYYHPMGNIMDLTFIDTLSHRDYLSGLAEVIKCAMINDKDFFEYLETNKDVVLKKDHDVLIELITKAITIKIDHVNGDLREGGKRLLLNYGHTLGHAIEISTEKNGHEQLRHGEGVSIGIVAVAYIATQYLNISKSIFERYENIFNNYGLPTKISASELGFDKETLLHKCFDNVKKDKKRLDNNIRLILSDEIGSAKVYNDVPFELIQEAFEYVIEE
ncbi:3-dehydroquinate synthase [Sulfurovum mangrovi]|uniref:3-dehydroquinate synthase n=1 Tax=Sulfurovum mangrovi TaxID=2893889 RepID=UPI001E44EB62|nr:3-dehydroquinate synthase [Sulfurovum mangrovi]UFH58842.1 3-dehydroquinate synthase [Sulfurovum mangrovi]